MDYEWLCRQLRDNWKYWIDLERGTVVVMLREAGKSKPGLAKIVGCSEG